MTWATFLANPGLGQRLLSAGSAECYFPPILLTRSRSFSPYVFGIRSASALRIAALVYMAIPASQNLALSLFPFEQSTRSPLCGDLYVSSVSFLSASGRLCAALYQSSRLTRFFPNDQKRFALVLT